MCTLSVPVVRFTMHPSFVTYLSNLCQFNPDGTSKLDGMKGDKVRVVCTGLFFIFLFSLRVHMPLLCVTRSFASSLAFLLHFSQLPQWCCSWSLGSVILTRSPIIHILIGKTHIFAICQVLSPVFRCHGAVKRVPMRISSGGVIRPAICSCSN